MTKSPAQTILQDDDNDNMGNIGATIKLSRDTGFSLCVIIRGSPADQIPRTLGDRDELISIDDVPLKGCTVQEAKSKVDCSVGSKVKLTLLKTFSDNVSEITLFRSRVFSSPCPPTKKYSFAVSASMSDTRISHSAQSFISQALKAKAAGDFLGATALYAPQKTVRQHQISSVILLAQLAWLSPGYGTPELEI